jgi:hypothetical protein
MTKRMAFSSASIRMELFSIRRFQMIWNFLERMRVVIPTAAYKISDLCLSSVRRRCVKDSESCNLCSLLSAHTHSTILIYPRKFDKIYKH